MTIAGPGRMARWLLCLSLLLAGGPLWASRVPITVGAEWQEQFLVSWAELELDATPEIAFAVLTDYARQPEFLPGMRSARIVSRRGTTVVVEQEIEESVLMFRQRLQVTMEVVETAPRQMSLRLLEGSFHFYEGFYALLPVSAGSSPARTRVNYRARFEPDFDLPRMMGPFIVKRSLEKNLRAFAAEVERRVAAATAR